MASSRVVLLVSDSLDGMRRAIAVEFAKLGYRIALTCSDKIQLEANISSLATEAPTTFGVEENYLALTVDFRNENQIDEIVPRVVSKFGQLDILVNNVDHLYRSLDILDGAFCKEFNTTLQVNLYAPTRLAQLAAPYLLRASEGGAIINVVPSFNRASSCSISREVVRAGLSMLTKTLANSFENKNVRCLTISSSPTLGTGVPEPGLAYSGDKVAGPTISATEMANLVVFLASNKAGYINGTTIEVAGCS